VAVCDEQEHEHGCLWDMSTCHEAASFKNGHLEVLKYADEHGCPYDEFAPPKQLLPSGLLILAIYLMIARLAS
jgi:hypothetical protein